MDNQMTNGLGIFDTEDRKAASEELAVNTFIDAGAGTGKTETIVSRIINKIASEPDFKIVDLAAITFTEKAAAELRSRFRKLLNGRKQQATEDQLQRLNNALSSMDSALIGTIHSFCKQILTDHSIAAGLPVGFQIGSENQSSTSRVKRARKVADLCWDELSDEDKAQLRSIGFKGKQMESIVFLLDQKFAIVNELDGDLSSSSEDLPFQKSVYKFIFLAIDYLKKEQMERRAQGEIEFDDLLIMTRDLLKSEAKLRRDVAKKYKVLLVDEFQDTDPIQWQIINLITRDSKDSKLRPGSLVLVGDPKQSIYRFRNADLNTFIQVKNQFEFQEGSMGKVCNLNSNFRSVAGLVDFVNWIFQDFKVGLSPLHLGVNYKPLHAVNNPSAPTSGPAVRVIPGPAAKEAKITLYEFARTAKEIRRAIEGKYLVTEREANGGRHYRDKPATFGDVAILLPVRTRINDLIMALSREKVPFTSADPDLVFARPLVSGLINALKVIAQTDDQMALWACLKSPLFAFSDEDLYLYKQGAGTSWDIDGYATGNNPEVLEALDSLFQIRRTAGKQSPYLALDLLLKKQEIFEKLTADPNGVFEADAIRMLLAYTQRWENQGNTGLLEFLSALDTLMEQKAKSLLPVPDDLNRNAVQIMTIHAAKGLEFPITVVSGMASYPSPAKELILISKAGKIEFYLGTDDDDNAIQSSGYDFLADGEIALAEKEESNRLLYVAMTRARDHLILSAVINPNDTRARSLALVQTLEALKTSGSNVFEWCDDDDELPELIPSQVVEVEKLDLPEEIDLSVQLANSAVRRVVSPSSLEGVGMSVLSRAKGEELVLEEKGLESLDNQDWDTARAISMAARDGRPFGKALHGVMDMIIRLGKIPEETTLQNFIWQNAQNENALAEIDSLTTRVKLLLENQIVLDAIHSDQAWPELHLAIADPNDKVSLAEGFADLVYKSDRGYVLVDYKTDGEINVEKRMHYQQQLGAYALILETITGQLPVRIVLLQVTDHEVREIDLEIP